MPEAYPPHAELRLRAMGQIEWRGSGLGVSGDWQHVTTTELRELLRITDMMPVPAYLVVDVSADAPCELVNSVSRDLQQLPMCGDGRCLERAAWDNYVTEPLK